MSEIIKPDFSKDPNGLIPAIAQDAEPGEVLMLAWMNGEALADTLTSGYLCYWSRSRAKLWRKGEISGQRQRLIRIRLDCDGDTLLVDVEQTGVEAGVGRHMHAAAEPAAVGRAG